MKIPVRATKAYLAGFGTAGSLVAGAALLFVLGSAIVAFRGWPQIGAGPATTVVAAARLPTPRTLVARRLAAAFTRRTSLPRAAGAIATRRAAHVNAPGNLNGRSAVRGVRTGAGTPGPSGVAASNPPVSPSPTRTPTTGGCVSSCNQPGPHNVIARLTHVVAQAVSNVGTQAGSQVTGVANSVGGSVSGVSPQVGTAVQNVGGSAGSAVSGTANTVGNVVTQVGGALSGGH
jgi:hypothetical protein